MDHVANPSGNTGKTIFLATKELFDGCKENYINQIERIGKSFSYVYDENRKKVKDDF